MTAVDLDALDAARAAATPGEWSSQENRIYARGYRVATVVLGGEPGAPEADVALIVAAVNALPELIAAARELRALREAVAGAKVDYLCIGHPGWPDPLVVHSEDRAREWLDEYGSHSPKVRVEKRTTIRTVLAAALTSEGERE